MYMEFETYEGMMDFCDEHRDLNRICSLCGECSGPKFVRTEVSCEYEPPKPLRYYEGGTHGSCRLYVNIE